MATVTIDLTCNLQKAVQVQYLNGNMFSADNAGNTINVYVMDGEEPATIGGSVSASVIRADGSTVAVSGALEGNKAYVILPQACYAVPGVISIVIKNTQNSTVTTIAALVANVYQSSTDVVVDPGTIIPSVQNLIAAIEAAVGSIPADYSSLWTSLAPAFSTSTAYTVGQYVTNNGGLYRFIADHAAGTWNSAHVVAANLGNDISALKSAFINTLDKQPTRNLFDPYTMTDNLLINESGVESTNANYITSDFILITNVNAVITSIGAVDRQYKYRVAVYDANKTWKRRVLGTSDTLVLDGVNNNYIRICFEKARQTDFNTVQVELGSTATAYVPHQMPFDYNGRIMISELETKVNKNVRFVTPEEFGAVGDGVTNDTTAIQAMFDYIAEIADNYNVVCTGKTGKKYTVRTISINTSTYNLNHNIAINNFTFGVYYDSLLFTSATNNHYGFHFNNCRFIGRTKATDVFTNNYVITLSSFRDCVFYRFKNIVYADVFGQGLYFDDCTFYDCDKCFYCSAFFTLTCNKCKFSRCNAILEQTLLNNLLSENLRIMQRLSFDNCTFEYYSDFVIRACAFSSMSLEGCYFEHGGLNDQGEHISSRDGVVLYENSDYARKKSVLKMTNNHFQDTVDAQFSPKMVNASNATFDSIVMIGNISYNTRFLALVSANCTGSIVFFGNCKTKAGETIGDIYGDFSTIKLSGYVDGTLYINGSEYV